MLKDFRKFKGWKVLEFFLTSDEKMGIRELARKLQISSMTAKHYCDVFEKSGLIRSEKAGTAKLFSIKDNVQVRQWKIAYTVQLIGENKLADVINNPFYIFGSVAKGAWRRGSDLDLFIIKIQEIDKDRINDIISKMGFEPSIIVVDFYKLDKFKISNRQLIEEVKKGLYIGDLSHEL